MERERERESADAIGYKWFIDHSRLKMEGQQFIVDVNITLKFRILVPVP